MRDRNEISKVFLINIRYAFIQIGLWLICFFTLRQEDDIRWFIGLVLVAPIMLTFIVPYMASKAMQRKTMLGYAFSRNITLTLHVGIGIILSLRILQVDEWYHYVFPTCLIIFGVITSYITLRKRSSSTIRLVGRKS